MAGIANNYSHVRAGVGTGAVGSTVSPVKATSKSIQVARDLAIATSLQALEDTCGSNGAAGPIQDFNFKEAIGQTTLRAKRQGLAHDIHYKKRMNMRLDNLKMLEVVVEASKASSSAIQVVDVWGWGVGCTINADKKSGVSQYDTFILKVNDQTQAVQLGSSFGSQLENLWAFLQQRNLEELSQFKGESNDNNKLENVGKVSTVTKTEESEVVHSDLKCYEQDWSDFSDWEECIGEWEGLEYVPSELPPSALPGAYEQRPKLLNQDEMYSSNVDLTSFEHEQESPIPSKDLPVVYPPPTYHYSQSEEQSPVPSAPPQELVEQMSRLNYKATPYAYPLLGFDHLGQSYPLLGFDRLIFEETDSGRLSCDGDELDVPSNDEKVMNDSLKLLPQECVGKGSIEEKNIDGKNVDPESLKTTIEDDEGVTYQVIKYSRIVGKDAVPQYMSVSEYGNRLKVLRAMTSVVKDARDKAWKTKNVSGFCDVFVEKMNEFLEENKDEPEMASIVIQGMSTIVTMMDKEIDCNIEGGVPKLYIVEKSEHSLRLALREGAAKSKLDAALELLAPCGNFEKTDKPRYAGFAFSTCTQGGNNGQVLGGNCSNASNGTINFVVNRQSTLETVGLGSLESERSRREKTCGPGRRSEVDLILAMTSQGRLNAFIEANESVLPHAQLEYLRHIEIDEDGNATLDNPDQAKKDLLGSVVKFEGEEDVAYAQLIYDKAVKGRHGKDPEEYVTRCWEELNTQLEKLELGHMKFPHPDPSHVREQVKKPQLLGTPVAMSEVGTPGRQRKQVVVNRPEEIQVQPIIDPLTEQIPVVQVDDLNENLKLNPYDLDETKKVSGVVEIRGEEGPSCRVYQYTSVVGDGASRKEVEQFVLESDRKSIRKLINTLQEMHNSSKNLAEFIAKVNTYLHESGVNRDDVLRIIIGIVHKNYVLFEVVQVEEIPLEIALVQKTNLRQPKTADELRKKTLRENLSLLSPLGSFGNANFRCGGISFGPKTFTGNNGKILGGSCSGASYVTVGEVVKATDGESVDYVMLELERERRLKTCGYGRRDEVDLIFAMTTQRRWYDYIGKLNSERRITQAEYDYLSCIEIDEDGKASFGKSYDKVEQQRKLLHSKITIGGETHTYAELIRMKYVDSKRGAEYEAARKYYNGLSIEFGLEEIPESDQPVHIEMTQHVPPSATSQPSRKAGGAEDQVLKKQLSISVVEDDESEASKKPLKQEVSKEEGPPKLIKSDEPPPPLLVSHSPKPIKKDLPPTEQESSPGETIYKSPFAGETGPPPPPPFGEVNPKDMPQYIATVVAIRTGAPIKHPEWVKFVENKIAKFRDDKASLPHPDITGKEDLGDTQGVPSPSIQTEETSSKAVSKSKSVEKVVRKFNPKEAKTASTNLIAIRAYVSGATLLKKKGERLMSVLKIFDSNTMFEDDLTTVTISDGEKRLEVYNLGSAEEPQYMAPADFESLKKIVETLATEVAKVSDLQSLIAKINDLIRTSSGSEHVAIQVSLRLLQLLDDNLTLIPTYNADAPIQVVYKEAVKEPELDPARLDCLRKNMAVLGPLGSFGDEHVRFGAFAFCLRPSGGSNGAVLGGSCAKASEETMKEVVKAIGSGDSEVDLIRLAKERDRREFGEGKAYKGCGYGRREEVDICMAMMSPTHRDRFLEKMKKEKKLMPAEIAYLEAIQFDKDNNATISDEAKKTFLTSWVVYADEGACPYWKVLHKKLVVGKKVDKAVFESELANLDIKVDSDADVELPPVWDENQNQKIPGLVGYGSRSAQLAKSAYGAKLKFLEDEVREEMLGDPDHEAWVEVFEAINFHTIQQPYVMENKMEKGAEHLWKKQVHGVYRPNHEGTHAARKVHYLKAVMQELKKTSKCTDLTQSRSTKMSDEHWSALYLGIYCSRAGRVDESAGGKGDKYRKRSAQIFKFYAKQLGYSDSVITSIKEAMQRTDTQVALGNAPKDNGPGLSPREEFIGRAMSIAHSLDLQRCFGPTLMAAEQVRMITDLKYFGFDESKAGDWAVKWQEMAKKCMHVTGVYKRDDINTFEVEVFPEMSRNPKACFAALEATKEDSTL